MSHRPECFALTFPNLSLPSSQPYDTTTPPSNPQKPSEAMSNQEADLFDSLLNLEETFYQEGYADGVADGERAGLVEGRIFGLEKGFEKYVRMGRLHGKAVVWAGRLPPRPENETRPSDDDRIHSTKIPGTTEIQEGDGETSPPLASSEEGQLPPAAIKASALKPLPFLSDNPRLEKHIRTLYALVEPSSLSTTNSEEAVADFDDRLKRAEGKVKIIEKLIGELGDGETMRDGEQGGKISQKSSGDGSIEDISSLRVRR